MNQVKEIAHDIDSGLEVVTCGSYRRGKLTCGDIDILITHPDGRSHKGVFDILLKRGHACGFLTDDLSVHNEASRGKYLGVCKLEGEGRKVRVFNYRHSTELCDVLNVGCDVSIESIVSCIDEIVL